jgi:hypothetical protein
LVHCRALLEFLGLCDRKGTLSQIGDKERRKTDVGVEHFSNADGPLKKVEPDVALSWYEGERSEAEKALLTILHITNKLDFGHLCWIAERRCHSFQNIDLGFCHVGGPA